MDDLEEMRAVMLELSNDPGMIPYNLEEQKLYGAGEASFLGDIRHGIKFKEIFYDGQTWAQIDIRGHRRPSEKTIKKYINKLLSDDYIVVNKNFNPPLYRINPSKDVQKGAYI